MAPGERSPAQENEKILTPVPNLQRRLASPRLTARSLRQIISVAPIYVVVVTSDQSSCKQLLQVLIANN
jgi:hypothetical protein